MYAIKDKLLQKYGKPIDNEVQFIDGKKCWSCNGTGIYHAFYHNRWHHESCYHCNRGWFKRPQWILLQVYELGKYRFHRPLQRLYSIENPYLIPHKIEGYIDHRYSQYGDYYLMLLYLLFDRKAFRDYIKGIGIGWRSYWWYPRNWLYVIVHIVRYRRKSYPVRKMMEKTQRWLQHQLNWAYYPPEELPF